MKTRVILPLTLLAILAIIFLASGTFRTPAVSGDLVEVGSGPFEVWSVYEGTLEARSLKSISSKRRGSATIEDIVPQGSSVEKGQVLARFDSESAETEVLNLERDYALAKAELEILQNATHPLAIRDLETKLIDAKIQRDAEEQYLVDTRELFAEDLVSEQEVKQQEVKTEAAKTLVETLEMELKLTKKYLHPSAISRAKATLESAEQRLALSREAFEGCTVTAPVDGMVVYKPVHVGGEYRTVRVGDTIYRSQTFMILPDMSDPIVQCNVPEAELARVTEGCRAVIVPLAYPDMRLEGAVESVGSMAQNVMGRPGWQKYFVVLIRLNEVDPRLRAGMSVRANVLSYSSPKCLLVPRAAVRWDGETAYCEVKRGGGVDRREVELGMANDGFFEVRNGLQPGERVVIQ